MTELAYYYVTVKSDLEDTVDEYLKKNSNWYQKNYSNLIVNGTILFFVLMNSEQALSLKLTFNTKACVKAPYNVTQFTDVISNTYRS